MYRSLNDEDAHKKKATAEPTDDRMRRGQIHQEVRRIFRSMIETSTDDAGVISATVASRKSRKRGRGGRGNRAAGGGEEKPAGEYLLFTLYKENRDTMDAVNQVARMLRVKPQAIGYMGTKDRRASTVQRCSVRYARTGALASANARLRGVVTGDYEYAQRPVWLGQLRGNEFVIVIKDCRLTSAAAATAEAPLTQRIETLQRSAQSALDHMNEHGWINYFGLQRFGTHHIGTHEVGKLILGEKYEEAVRALLSYDADIAERAEKGEVPAEASTRDEFARHQACMLFMTGKDPDRACQVIPRRFGAEVCILRHLNRAGAQSRKDFVGAIVHITRGLRSMYLHAYQSYVWNHAASRRWELHGERVVKGDLVVVPEAEAAAAAAAAEPEKDQDGDDVITPAAQVVNHHEDDDPEGDAPVRARPLTEEEASSGRYTIHDVVLPSPGYDVTYPDNEIGAYYAEFMSRPDNGGLDPHKMRRIRREFSLPGRYRRLLNRFLAPPSIEVRAYASDLEQMHPTDLDVLRAEKRASGHEEPAAKKAKTEDGQAEGQGEGQEDKADKIAAIVKFQLGSSAYATVTLRELMGDPPEGGAAPAA